MTVETREANDILRLVRTALERNDTHRQTVDRLAERVRPRVPIEEWSDTYAAQQEIFTPLREAEERLRARIGQDGPPARDPMIVDLGEQIDRGERTVRDRLRDGYFERFHRRFNASWSYLDLMSREPLITEAETPILYLLVLPLGKPDKKHGIIKEEHNRSGYHFHYSKLNGLRSDILLSFSRVTPKPDYPVTWERHGDGKFFPKPEHWGYKKCVNVNEVCVTIRSRMSASTTFYTPSKEAQLLLASARRSTTAA